MFIGDTGSQRPPNGVWSLQATASDEQFAGMDFSFAGSVALGLISLSPSYLNLPMGR